MSRYDQSVVLLVLNSVGADESARENRRIVSLCAGASPPAAEVTVCIESIPLPYAIDFVIRAKSFNLLMCLRTVFLLVIRSIRSILGYVYVWFTGTALVMTSRVLNYVIV